jgi:cold shock CspA family protein
MLVINYGTLIKWQDGLNYGFVRDDSSGKDLFIHIGGFLDKINPPQGARLKYHVAPNPKKPGKLMVVDAEVIVSRVIAAQYSDERAV